MRTIIVIIACAMATSCGSESASQGPADSSSDTSDTTAMDASGDDTAASDLTNDDGPGLPDAQDLEPEVSPVVWVPGTPVQAEVFLSKAQVGKVEGLAFDGQSTLYLTATNGDIIEVKADGTSSVVATVPAVDGFPSANLAGATYSPQWGPLFVQYSGDRLYSYSPQDGLKLIREDLAKGPNGILAASNGKLYISLSETGTVVELDSPDGTMRVITDSVSFPNGLAFRKATNTLYVASTMPKGEIFTLDLNSSPATPVLYCNSSDIKAADGLVFAPDGHLLVAAFGAGKVVAIDPDDGNITAMVSQEPANALGGVASLAFGSGEGFDPTCLFATNMLMGGLLKICP